MRIVAGALRGRTLKAPAGSETRPTTDRVREAVFSAVASIAGADLGGGTALDAFAGSGALGFEALSRGCDRVVFAEQHRTALATLKANVAALGVAAQTDIVAGDVILLASRGTLPRSPFSLLLLDPPYRLEPAQVALFVEALARNEQLVDGALVVYEHGAGAGMAWPDGFSAIRSKRYGSTEVDIAVFERGDAAE